MNRLLGIIAAGIVFGATPGSSRASAEQDPRREVDPFQRRVDAAIERGIAYLKKSNPSPPGFDIGESYELVLWTFVHAGMSQTDPLFQKLFRQMIEAPLEKTYRVALQAMILEEVDRVQWQERIWQCAQFLVDNQDRTGQWGYGEPTLYGKPPAAVPTGGKRPATPTAGGGPKADPSLRPKPAIRMRLPVKKQRDGAGHDNSNSQYAALGLRACHDAGIILPKEVIERARKWWVDCQISEEDGAAGTAGVRPLGWCYSEGGAKAHCATACGAMTAGAVGALCIYDYILDERQSWKKDPAVLGGLAWLARNFTVTRNPGSCEMGSEGIHYYYLYALERAGVLFGADLVGRHDWYREGAELLLKSQQAGGSWSGGGNAVWDTCFAILFLRRATRPFGDVASVDRFHPRKDE
jgi:hypothetical protein